MRFPLETCRECENVNEFKCGCVNLIRLAQNGFYFRRFAKMVMKYLVLWRVEFLFSFFFIKLTSFTYTI